MVFASLNPARDTYRLWHRFRMPTSGGSKDAVAVTTKVGDQLLAAYTFMLSHIVLLVWWIAIIVALFLSAKIHKHDNRNSQLHVKIWNKRSSPYRIVKLAFHRFLWPHPKPKQQSKSGQQSDIEHHSDLEPKPSRLYLLLWFLIGVSFLVVKYAIPIYFAGFIRIGNAAPVSKDAIYIPSLLVIESDATPPLQRSLGELQVRELFISSALRAVGGIDAANDTFKGNPPVIVDPPEILGTDGNETSMRIGYRYNVTGLDFGLQHYPDLLLTVEGACMTEYGWWLNSTNNDSTLPGAFVETYDMYGAPAKVSKYDGGSPIAQFYYEQSATDLTNTSWAALISSVDRSSYTIGTDPFYLTGPNPLATADSDDPYHAPYSVLPQRPVLSCWETNVWSHDGRNVALINISDPGIGLLPSGLAVILFDFINYPMVYSLGGFLGQSALKSSATSLAAVIDASTSSIYADLQRLLFASYIATTNIFTETTLFSGHGDIPNDVLTDGNLNPGTSDFVIFSNEVETLSVKSLIIIPTITVALWVILTLITLLPNIVAMVATFSGGKKEEEKVKEEEVEEEKKVIADKKADKKDEEEEKVKRSDSRADILQPAKDDAKEQGKEQAESLKEGAKDSATEIALGAIFPDDDD